MDWPVIWVAVRAALTLGLACAIIATLFVGSGALVVAAGLGVGVGGWDVAGRGVRRHRLRRTGIGPAPLAGHLDEESWVPIVVLVAGFVAPLALWGDRPVGFVLAVVATVLEAGPATLRWRHRRLAAARARRARETIPGAVPYGDTRGPSDALAEAIAQELAARRSMPEAVEGDDPAAITGTIAMVRTRLRTLPEPVRSGVADVYAQAWQMGRADTARRDDLVAPDRLARLAGLVTFGAPDAPPQVDIRGPMLWSVTHGYAHGRSGEAAKVLRPGSA